MNRDMYENYEGRTVLSTAQFLELVERGEKNFSKVFLPDNEEIENVTFDNCSFEGSYLYMRFTDCIFKNCSFNRVSMYGNIEGSVFETCTFEKAHLSVRINESSITNCTFADSRWKNGYIKQTTLKDVDISNLLFDGTWAGKCIIETPLKGIPLYTQGGATRNEMLYSKKRLFEELKISV